MNRSDDNTPVIAGRRDFGPARHHQDAGTPPASRITSELTIHDTGT